MKRVYRPYWEWEDWNNGMWQPLHGKERAEMLEMAILFTGDHILYGKWMDRVVSSWPLSCEHNLTCVSMNRLAWIGHAATCLAIKCPEMITREAWGYLSQEQRDLANLEASRALRSWRYQYERETSCMGGIVGEKRLF